MKLRLFLIVVKHRLLFSAAYATLLPFLFASTRIIGKHDAFWTQKSPFSGINWIFITSNGNFVTPLFNPFLVMTFPRFDISLYFLVVALKLFVISVGFLLTPYFVPA
ncbi:hypothetical protein GDO78_018359 [Eleutherodactylus coqui]|uniref:Uncharacterized protein n=1 Tax=Eleutherodactylus coqui TaxID=57060 RepID=A0A8J6BQB4_ELECQ|nr:hypothetical protein GDO78_018359 [Eleutherodactylus coqui]